MQFDVTDRHVPGPLDTDLLRCQCWQYHAQSSSARHAMSCRREQIHSRVNYCIPSHTPYARDRAWWSIYILEAKASAPLAYEQIRAQYHAQTNQPPVHRTRIVVPVSNKQISLDHWVTKTKLGFHGREGEESCILVMVAEY
jgi:hypothetical protein